MISNEEFLKTVITGGEGWFLLAVGNSGAHWHEEWFEYPKEIPAIVARADALKDDNNVYFSSYLFNDRRSTKECVLPTLTIQADLDEADITSLPIEPTVIVQTSPGRHQAYWVLNQGVDLEVHEILSRKMTYAIPSCDRSGWPLGRKVRFPGTFNHKYIEGRKLVQVTQVSGAAYSPDTLELLPEVPKIIDEQLDQSFVEAPPTLEIGPQTLLETFKQKIPATVYTQYNIVAQDRSAALWALMCALFRAGATRQEVYHLSLHTINNKFKGLRYHAERELAKDVIRAEITVNSGKQDMRALVMQIRKLPGLIAEKRGYIKDAVREAMANEGTFMHTSNDECFYIRQDIGRPIHVGRRSDFFNQLLDIEFGLNPTEQEHGYTCHGLENYVRGLPINAESRTMSYFDMGTRTCLIHTHRKEVIRVTANDITRVGDGAYNILFPWDNASDPFMPSYTPLDVPWYETLFGGVAGQSMSGTREQAMHTLRVWFLFVLLRDATVSRPILALFGQPGCLSGETELEVFYEGADDVEYSTLADMYKTWEFHPPTKLAIMSMKDDIADWREVHNVLYSGKKLTYTVTVEDCQEFRVTEDHKFMVADGKYKTLKQLKLGELVMTLDGLKPLLTSTAYGFEDTYDITMKDQEAPNFLVNDVVVHNSGKSTAFRMIYALLYGKRKSLGGITNADDFDFQMACNPLVVIDNADTWERWLPDRLAQSAAAMDIQRRKLWTDLDTVILKRQAVLGMTAHNPKFGREDVNDRLLLFTLHRLPSFQSETEIIDNIIVHRNQIWGAVIKDLQTVLRTPLPDRADVPQMRVEDFARIGHWIATALGCAPEFKAMVTQVVAGQKIFSLEEEGLLVDALALLIAKDPPEGTWRNPGVLWSRLQVLSNGTEFQHQYHNAITLGKKLWSLADSLKEVFNVEVKFDHAKQSRTWRFSARSKV